MANLTESPIYEPGIFQLEKSTPPLGGAPVIDNGVPSAGHANAQGLQLANRTAYLKQQLEAGGSATALQSDLQNNSDPAKGAGQVGFDGGSVKDALYKVKVLKNYTELRAYTGAATRFSITDAGIEGNFNSLGVVAGYTDDGATTIITAAGVVLQREIGNKVSLSWWEVVGSPNVTSKLLKAISLGKPVEMGVGTFLMNASLPSGTILIGQGKSKTLVKPIAGNTGNAINLNGVNGVQLSGFRVQGSATAKEGESLGLIHCSNGFYNVHIRDLEVIQGSQCGIVMVGGAESNERSTIIDCGVYSNRFDGIQISETKHVDLINNQVHDNSHHGIALQPSVWPPTAYAVDDILLNGNRVYNNIGHGIYVLPLIMGGTSFTNFTYSFTEQQYCKDIRVTDNHVYANAATGIMAGGFNSTYSGNTCVGNGTIGDGYSGIVVAGVSLSVVGNTCTSNSTYGIDVGGSLYSTISANTCSYNAIGKTFSIGLNLGASSFCTVSNNIVTNNGPDTNNSFQIMIAGWDGDGVYSYELAGSQNVVIGNTVRGTPNSYGIYVRRYANYHHIADNFIGQTSRLNALVNEVDFSQGTNTIINNTHDISSVFGGVTIPSATTLIIDDYNSEYVVTGTTNITSIQTKTNNDNVGKIVATKMTAQGSGYTTKPTVTITGGGGTGATATAEIGRGGKVIAISITNGGSGYTSNPTITISGGGGTGATATAVFGMKNYTGRKITLQFEGVLTVNISGMNSSYTAAGGSTLTLEGRKNGNGQWVEISRSA